MEAVWKSIVAWTKISGRRRVVLCPVPIWVVRGAQRNKCYGNQWDSNCQLSIVNWQTKQDNVKYLISIFNSFTKHATLTYYRVTLFIQSFGPIYYVYIRKIINY
jgi:hypothetical protein